MSRQAFFSNRSPCNFNTFVLRYDSIIRNNQNILLVESSFKEGEPSAEEVIIKGLVKPSFDLCFCCAGSRDNVKSFLSRAVKQWNSKNIKGLLDGDFEEECDLPRSLHQLYFYEIENLVMKVQVVSNFLNKHASNLERDRYDENVLKIIPCFAYNMLVHQYKPIGTDFITKSKTVKKILLDAEEFNYLKPEAFYCSVQNQSFGVDDLIEKYNFLKTLYESDSIEFHYYAKGKVLLDTLIHTLEENQNLVTCSQLKIKLLETTFRKKRLSLLMLLVDSHPSNCEELESLETFIEGFLEAS